MFKYFSYTVKNREYMTTLMTKKFQSRYLSLKEALRKCQSCSFTTAISQSKSHYFLRLLLFFTICTEENVLRC